METIRTLRNFVFAVLADAEKRKVMLTIDYIVREFSSGARVRRRFTPAYSGFLYTRLIQEMVHQGLLAYSQSIKARELEIGFTPQGKEIYLSH